MRVSWNWVREFVEVEDSPYAIADRLTMAGLEVEAIERVGEQLGDVLIGELVAVRPSPVSPGLRLCEVRTNPELITTVLSPLAGLQAGARVALAPLGAHLPSGKTVAYAEEGGVHSLGHICSEADLGLGPDSERALIVDEDAPVGASLAKHLRLEDFVLEVAVTPNRGDCLSVLGIAREIAALTGARLKRPRWHLAERGEETERLVSVRIADEAGCRRYVARVVTGVRVAPSPLWLQYRLRSVGLRPINNVVDVTNYVLWERGQPLHAFDFDRLPAKEIVVDRAREEIPFQTLDGVDRRLEADDVVIFAGATPVAIAGVMGGANSEVHAGTSTVLLESAWFSPVAVRRTARRLGLRTEASYRFERVVDIEGVAAAADRAAGWIAELTGGQVARTRVDVYPRPAEPAPIALRLKRVGELLGVEVPRQQVVQVLKRLGMEVTSAPYATLNVVPPSYRSDLEREIDLVEEVARVVGYEQIPVELPAGTVNGKGLGETEAACREVRRFLIAQGFCEAVPLAFASHEENQHFPGIVSERSAVALSNPLSQNDAEMRLSLTSSLVRLVRRNLAQGEDAVALFLLGKVFWEERGARERLHVGGVVCPRFPAEGIGVRRLHTEFADLKGVVVSLLELLGIHQHVQWQREESLPGFHPGQCAQLVLDGHVLGVAGGLHPDLEEAYELAHPCWVFELDLETGLQYRPRRVTFREWPRFPEVKRDLAVVADGHFPAGEVVRFVEGCKSAMPWIEEIAVVDEYSGPPIPPGKKSLTYAISYRAADRTLTDAEVNQAHAELTTRIVRELGVTPR